MMRDRLLQRLATMWQELQELEKQKASLASDMKAIERVLRLFPNGTRHSDVKVEEATKETPSQRAKNPAAVALGRLGGRKGGKARMESLNSEQRKELAKKAAEARWHPLPIT